MTLNGVIALILLYFTADSIVLKACYVTVVDDRPILCADFWPKLTYPAV